MSVKGSYGGETKPQARFARFTSPVIFRYRAFVLCKIFEVPVYEFRLRLSFLSCVSASAAGLCPNEAALCHILLASFLRFDFM